MSLDYIETVGDRKTLDEIIEAAKQKIKQIDKTNFKDEFEKKFPDVRLEFCSVDLSFNRIIKIKFYLTDKLLNLDCFYFYSERGYEISMTMEEFGTAEISKEEMKRSFYFGPNYRQIIPENKQDVFNKIVLFTADRCFPDNLFESNPFECPQDKVDFFEKGYKLAKDMGIEIEYFSMQKCFAMTKNYECWVYFDESMSNRYRGEIAIFRQRLIEMR